MIPQCNPLLSYLHDKEKLDQKVQNPLSSSWYILGREVEMAGIGRSGAASRFADSDDMLTMPHLTEENDSYFNQIIHRCFR